ncbi:nuclear transport factor 2 family protein [Epilithonimonas bovis]|nr:nuclear transport factor 2 family protein [Epilithonimonas bovis]
MTTCCVEQLESILHDDLLFILPDGTTITKDMDLDTYRKECLWKYVKYPVVPEARFVKM